MSVDNTMHALKEMCEYNITTNRGKTENYKVIYLLTLFFNTSTINSGLILSAESSRSNHQSFNDSSTYLVILQRLLWNTFNFQFRSSSVHISYSFLLVVLLILLYPQFIFQCHFFNSWQLLVPTYFVTFYP